MSERHFTRTPREPNTRTEVMFVRVIQLLHRLYTAVYKSLRAEQVIAHQPLLFRDGREVFPAQPKREHKVRPELPVILHKQSVGARTEISLAAGLSTRVRVHR